MVTTSVIVLIFASNYTGGVFITFFASGHNTIHAFFIRIVFFVEGEVFLGFGKI